MILDLLGCSNKYFLACFSSVVPFVLCAKRSKKPWKWSILRSRIWLTLPLCNSDTRPIGMLKHTFLFWFESVLPVPVTHLLPSTARRMHTVQVHTMQCPVSSVQIAHCALYSALDGNQRPLECDRRRPKLHALRTLDSFPFQRLPRRKGFGKIRTTLSDISEAMDTLWIWPTHFAQRHSLPMEVVGMPSSKQKRYGGMTPAVRIVPPEKERGGDLVPVPGTIDDVLWLWATPQPLPFHSAPLSGFRTECTAQGTQRGIPHVPQRGSVILSWVSWWRIQAPHCALCVLRFNQVWHREERCIYALLWSALPLVCICLFFD